MRPKRKRKEMRKKMKDRNLAKLLVSIALVICISIVLAGCAGHEKGDTYRVMIGKKCAEGGTISSWVWFHTTIGPDQVSKENCNGRSK